MNSLDKKEVLALQDKIRHMNTTHSTLECTNTELASPLLYALGYSPATADVIPNVAGYNAQRSDKPTYMFNGAENKVMWCKVYPLGTNLAYVDTSLLNQFEQVLTLKAFLLTNGDDYWFYLSNNDGYIFNKEPYFKFRLSTASESELDRLNEFSAAEMDKYAIKSDNYHSSGIKYPFGQPSIWRVHPDHWDRFPAFKAFGFNGEPREKLHDGEFFPRSYVLPGDEEFARKRLAELEAAEAAEAAEESTKSEQEHKIQKEVNNKSNVSTQVSVQVQNDKVETKAKQKTEHSKIPDKAAVELVKAEDEPVKTQLSTKEYTLKDALHQKLDSDTIKYVVVGDKVIENATWDELVTAVETDLVNTGVFKSNKDADIALLKVLCSLYKSGTKDDHIKVSFK